MKEDLLNGLGDAALGTVTSHVYSAAHPFRTNKRSRICSAAMVRPAVKPMPAV